METSMKLHEDPILKKLSLMLDRNKQLLNSVTHDLVDDEFLEEVKVVANSGIVGVYFGKTLRDLKMVVTDVDGRNHNIFFQYLAPRKLVVVDAGLPHAAIPNHEYKSLQEIIETFTKYTNDLSPYFEELEHIDQLCTVMEPINTSFKDNYRRILLDDRTWLHVEVTPEGLATNVHLVGQSTHWHNKLQSGLLMWDHDKNIVNNIMHIFDLDAFPQVSSTSRMVENPENKTEDELICGICLCPELAESTGVPQPLCQNATCGVHYHRSCLYQWLVASAGSRPPAFGVANGACPTCLQPITCSEKEN